MGSPINMISLYNPLPQPPGETQARKPLHSLAKYDTEFVDKRPSFKYEVVLAGSKFTANQREGLFFKSYFR
jgi:hypothetical protein